MATVKSTAKRARIQSSPVPESSPRASRFKAKTIGSVQNSVVRHLLGSIGEHSFTQKDWIRVRGETFRDRCAYCGGAGKLEMEHAIPCNTEKLGEHHLGNVVPACGDCNSDKQGKDYAEFLEDRPDRRERIDAHMKRHDYRPLRGKTSVQEILRAAREATNRLASEFTSKLNKEVGQS